MNIQDYVQKGATLADGLKTILVSSLIILFIFAIAIVIVKEMTASRLVLEAFDVPDNIRQNGFDGRVLSKHIMDHYYEIYHKASTLQESRGMEPKWDRKDVNFSIAETGFSLESIRNVLGYLNTRKTVVSGDVVKSRNNRFKLTLRINGIHSTIYGETTEKLIRNTAKEIIARTQPYIIAHYCWIAGDNKQCNDILGDILKDYSQGTDSLSQHAWAHVLLGRIHEKNGQYEAALKHFNRAIGKDPMFTLTYRNKAYLLRAYLNAPEESEKACISWLRIDPSSWRGHYYLALALQENKKYSKAGSSFEKTLELKKNLDKDFVDIQWSYLYCLYEWGKGLEEAGRFKEAIAKYKMALNVDAGSQDEALKESSVDNSGCYYKDLLEVFNRLGPLLSTCESTSYQDPHLSVYYNEKAAQIQKQFLPCISK